MITSLGTADLLVILLYFAFMIGVGIYYTKKIKDNDSFAVADRSLSMPVMIGTTVATCMGAGSAFGDVGYIFEVGLIGIISVTMWNVGWIALNIFSGKLRESGAASLPEFLEIRYGKSTKYIAAFVTLTMVMNACAAQFAAAGTVMETLGLIDKNTGIIIGGSIIILLTVFGGLYAVAITDAIQMILIFVGVVILVPIVAFIKAGGIGEVFSRAIVETPQMFDPHSIPFILLVGYALSYMLAAGSHPAYIQRILAAKDRKTAVVGSIWSNVLTVFFATPVLLVPLTAFILFPNMANGEMLVPTVIYQLFPPILKGLILASLLALIVTTADSFLLLLGTTISNDIVPIFKINPTPKQRLWISRAVVLLGGILIIILAINGGSVFKLFRMGAAAYGAGMFVPLACACFWKRTKTIAANWGMAVGCFSTIIWNLSGLGEATGIEGVIVGAVACLVLIAGISLIIKEDPTKLDTKTVE
jgi:SSS family solute:Na+ symporter